MAQCDGINCWSSVDIAVQLAELAPPGAAPGLGPTSRWAAPTAGAVPAGADPRGPRLGAEATRLKYSYGAGQIF